MFFYTLHYRQQYDIIYTRMYALRGNTGLGIHIVGWTDAAGLGIHIVGLTDAAGVCNTRNMLSTILHVLEVLQLVKYSKLLYNSFQVDRFP